ncbi:hypothetical protein [Plasticicumulans acidivorans]|uniref:hypothetical protein n=1 Tax=Plasticicumulans acidivorans TaxID=886464 RepID=UPI000D70FB0F|nr:hypothetical protein [Plasticicumulans acidivorans]
MKRKKILAVSSGGGHWIQLSKINKAFESHNVVYVTVYGGNRMGDAKTYFVQDANLTTKVKAAVLAIQILFIVLKERPDFVISTGAAPGYFAALFGKKILKCKVLWIDSIANAEVLSKSGEMVRGIADVVLTQWAHVAERTGVLFKGSIL